VKEGGASDLAFPTGVAKQKSPVGRDLVGVPERREPGAAREPGGEEGGAKVMMEQEGPQSPRNCVTSDVQALGHFRPNTAKTKGAKHRFTGREVRGLGLPNIYRTSKTSSAERKG